MAIEQRKIGSQTFDFDTDLGGAVVNVPKSAQPKTPAPPQNAVPEGEPVSLEGTKPDPKSEKP